MKFPEKMGNFLRVRVTLYRIPTKNKRFIKVERIDSKLTSRYLALANALFSITT
jgi:hypothetical protein